MSAYYNYYSDQRDPVEGTGGNSGSRDAEQGIPRSFTPQACDRGGTASHPRPSHMEGYQGLSGTPAYTVMRERVSPVSGIGHNVIPSRQRFREELGQPLEPHPWTTRPLSSESMHHMDSFDRSEKHIPQASPSFQSAYPPSQSSPSFRTPQGPWNDSGRTSRPIYPDKDAPPQPIRSVYPWDTSYQFPQDRLDYVEKSPSKRGTITIAGSVGDERRSKRYRGGRDEFDGSVQYLSKPPRNVPEPCEGNLPPLPVHLNNKEQEDVLTQVNKRLAQCAFDFVALYRFPIPMEPDKPAVKCAADKGWTEWAYLLKRLATKRRIPSHAIFQGQIKELTTVLDNSLEMRHASKPQPRPPKDDRTVLQFISAGIQVGKMLKDAAAMEYLDKLYQQIEKVIQERKETSSSSR